MSPSSKGESPHSIWRVPAHYLPDSFWTPLAGSRSSLAPTAFSTGPLSSSTPSHDDAARPADLHRICLLTLRLTHLLNLPVATAALADFVSLVGELRQFSDRVRAHSGYCESQKFVELLATVTSLRMHSAMLELGQAGGNAGEYEWERNAGALAVFNLAGTHAHGDDTDPERAESATLLAMHPLDCPQVYHLLAVTAFLHGAIIVALRLRRASFVPYP